MLTDGSTVPNGEVVTTDVCVIGAGPAGVSLARQVAATGSDVVLLEKGDEYRAAPPSTGETALSVGIPYSIEDMRASAFGGSVHRWRVMTPRGEGFGRLRELDEEDFEARDWVPGSGWPMNKDELRPHYRRAWALFGEPWPSVDDPGAKLEAELTRGPFEDPAGVVTPRMFMFAEPGIFAAEFRRELDRAENVLVLTNCRALELLSHESSSVSGVRASSVPGTEFTIVARAYILASGAIETPRLLLASRSYHPTGLGNRHDLVGRYFMEHPHYASGLLWPKHAELLHTPSAFAVHEREGVLLQRKFTIDERLVAGERLLRCAFLLESTPISHRIRALGYSESAVRSLQAVGDVRRGIASDGAGAPGWRPLARAALGMPHVARYTASALATHLGRRAGLHRYTSPQVFRIQAMAEQAPNPESRVTLDTSTDAFGVPRPRLDWQLTELDRRTMRRSQELFGDALRANGHPRVKSFLVGRDLPPALTGGSHLMGTTRMHDDPRQGVVDRDSRVHGVRNLYVAGSSVFPTVGYANPTLSILALALRLADHVNSVVRDG